MWDEQKRRRFQHLRERELAGALGDAERTELTLLIDALQAAEAQYVEPATHRLRNEREVIDVQNRALETLVQRKEKLAERLEGFLAETQAERRAIERELAAVLIGGPDAKANE